MKEKLLNIEISNGIAIKLLFEILKDVYTDISIIIKQDSLEINEFNNNSTFASSIKLDTAKFSKFEKKDKDDMFIGVNTSSVYSYLKNIDKKSSLNIYINNKDNQRIIFNIRDDNSDQLSEYKLKLQDHRQTIQSFGINNDIALCRLSSSLFKKICKELNIIENNDDIFIKFTKDSIKFRCFNTFSESIKEIYRSDDLFMKISDNTILDKEKIYLFKDIFNFSKCVNITDIITIAINKDDRLYIQSNIQNIGIITNMFSPKQDMDYDIDDDNLRFMDDNNNKIDETMTHIY